MRTVSSGIIRFTEVQLPRGCNPELLNSDDWVLNPTLYQDLPKHVLEGFDADNIRVTFLMTWKLAAHLNAHSPLPRVLEVLSPAFETFRTLSSAGLVNIVFWLCDAMSLKDRLPPGLKFHRIDTSNVVDYVGIVNMFDKLEPLLAGDSDWCELQIQTMNHAIASQWTERRIPASE